MNVTVDDLPEVAVHSLAARAGVFRFHQVCHRSDQRAFMYLGAVRRLMEPVGSNRGAILRHQFVAPEGEGVRGAGRRLFQRFGLNLQILERLLGHRDG